MVTLLGELVMTLVLGLLGLFVLLAKQIVTLTGGLLRLVLTLTQGLLDYWAGGLLDQAFPRLCGVFTQRGGDLTLWLFLSREKWEVGVYPRRSRR